MTEQEAIKVIRNKACNDRCTEIPCDDSCMYGERKCAFHMAIKALEKQIAKKPYVEADDDGFKLYHCPTCKMPILGSTEHCSDCGQKLDWE